MEVDVSAVGRLARREGENIMRIEALLRTHAWIIIISIILFCAPAGSLNACTTAVFSGSCTKSGRPILWKNRDTEHDLNQVVYRDDGKYPYVGVVNLGDGAGMEIWAGVNKKGFGIMNSASFNFKGGEESDTEGYLMKLALQSCVTIGDFEAILKSCEGASTVISANFGVFDASGGAACFEVGPHGYKRFDATDNETAPGGYLLRTNYSESGDMEYGYGYLRMEREADLTRKLFKSGGIDCASVLKVLSRDQANAALGSYPAREKTPKARWAFTGDSICRRMTTAAIVLEGVKPGEDPRAAHMWVILGTPVTGIAVPVWPAAGSVPDELAAGKEAAPIAKAAARIRDMLYPETKGSQAHYMDMKAFCAFRDTSLRGFLAEESGIMKETGKVLATWTKAGFPPSSVVRFQKKIAGEVLKTILSARTDVPTTEKTRQ